MFSSTVYFWVNACYHLVCLLIIKHNGPTPKNANVKIEINKCEVINQMLSSRVCENNLYRINTLEIINNSIYVMFSPDKIGSNVFTINVTTSFDNLIPLGVCQLLRMIRTSLNPGTVWRAVQQNAIYLIDIFSNRYKVYKMEYFSYTILRT